MDKLNTVRRIGYLLADIDRCLGKAAHAEDRGYSGLAEAALEKAIEAEIEIKQLEEQLK